MKVVNQQQKTIVTGVEVQDFGIVFDRHMVNILSNQLYENKVAAIVRELGTNAYDSHVENGNESEQVEVHVPTWNDQSYSIRDFGTGLSPDRVDKIYRFYGASDRKESNEFVGCMGLGSKSPFCYHTKTFTVDSWWNGMHYTYACFLNEDGMPQIAPMGSKPSNERTGVKITIPVSSGDTYTFEQEMYNIYKYFSVKPKFTNKSLDLGTIKYTLTSEDGKWKYAEGDRGGMRIIMGNVAYRVSDTALGDLTRYQQSVVNAPFHVFVEIGEVSPTASREGLDYTNRTKTHVRKYINDIIATFNSRIQKDIDKCTNLWEARKKFLEIQKKDKSNLLDPTKILYNGKALFTSINNTIQFEDMIKKGEIEAYLFEDSRYRSVRKQRVIGIRPTDEVELFVNDMTNGSNVRCIHVAKTEGKDVILVKFIHPVEQKFYDLLGLDASYFKDISTIPSPTVRQGGGARGRLTKIVTYKQHKRNWQPNLISGYWTDSEVDLEDGGIYVEFNRYNIRKNGQVVHPLEMANLLYLLDDLKVGVPSIYGIKTAHIDKVKNNPKWVNFYDWIVEKVKTFSNVDIEYIEKIKSHFKYLNQTYSRVRFDVDRLKKLQQYCDPKTKMYKFIATLKDLEIKNSKLDEAYAIKALYNRLNLKYEPTKQTVVDLTKLEEITYKHYPMLSVFNCQTISHSSLQTIGEYVNSIG